MCINEKQYISTFITVLNVDYNWFFFNVVPTFKKTIYLHKIRILSSITNLIITYQIRRSELN